MSRWREQTPYSKRVVALPDPTVLDWFRRGWDVDVPDEWIEDELDGQVYGLSSIFEKAQELALPPPSTIDELRARLHELLWVEANDKGAYIRLDEHSLRVRTDDDDVDLAYYFIDDRAALAAPDRLAFLLYDFWPLPGGAAPAEVPFRHDVPVRTAATGGRGSESVFSVRLCWDPPGADRNLDLRGATVFPGLTLPELGRHLLEVDDPGADRWPADARLLRVLVALGDLEPTLALPFPVDAVGIGPALDHFAALPGYDPVLPDYGAEPERSAKSLVQLGPHHAQVARYIDDFFGYDQWFLFDTRWAAAHPDLARSLLRYAAHWDPFDGLGSVPG